MFRILIADDDARIREAIREVVAEYATSVYEAADGTEAVAVCAAERPEWVLMDLRMKPMDGLRATAEIKARFPETRVAIVSQHDDPGLRAQAAQVGACAYILKEELLHLPAILTGDVSSPGGRKENAAPRHPWAT